MNLRLLQKEHTASLATQSVHYDRKNLTHSVPHIDEIHRLTTNMNSDLEWITFALTQPSNFDSIKES